MSGAGPTGSHDVIKIGITILDIADDIQLLMENMYAATEFFTEGTQTIADAYFGKANDLLQQYFKGSMEAQLGKLITYYGVCAQCIMDTFEQLMETDRELMQALLYATYGG